MSEKESKFIVGIGASAGGLEALQHFLEIAPIGENISYIIAQHMSPTHKSMLRNLLSKSSKLKTIEIENGMLIEGDSVYITPPNKNVKVKNSTLLLTTPTGENYVAKPSIDELFFSLSEIEDANIVGILLSGTGSDGTKGCIAIKTAGGITLAQDPKESTYNGMPQSAISAKAIDKVLSVYEMGEEILEIKKYYEDGSIGDFNPAKERSEYEKIIDILNKKEGVDFSLYKSDTIERRIERMMAMLKIKSTKELREHIEKNDDASRELYKDILIGVTSFFRDKEAFESFYKELDKKITSKDENESIRIWTIGSSTGEEAYSIAIIVSEILRKRKQNRNVQIFATDIDDDAISTGRRGEYPINLIQNIEKDYLNRYFDITQDRIRLHKNIRNMVIFSKHDITNDPPFNKLDAVVCRNLLIYFTHELQFSIFSYFHYALNDEGILFLGKSESLGQRENLFLQIDKHKIYKKVQMDNKIKELYQFKQKDSHKLEHVQSTNKKSLQEQMVEAIGMEFMPKSIVINENAEIIYVREEIPYLQVPIGTASFNIYKIIHHDLSLELRSLIHRAKKQRSYIKGSGVRVELNNEIKKSVRLSVIPFMENSRGEYSLYIVCFEDDHIKEGVDCNNLEADGKENITLLEDELAKTKLYLQSVIEELETSNEELQSTNEELQSSNEELQSTNEELETSNEELQSTNEELQITYSELNAISEERERQRKIAQESLESLSIANKELETRDRLLQGIMNVSISGVVVFEHTEDGLNCAMFNKSASEIIASNTKVSKAQKEAVEYFFKEESGFWSELLEGKKIDKKLEISVKQKRRWIHFLAAPFANGIVSIFYDITKEKVYEEELKYQLKLIKLALKSGNLGFWELKDNNSSLTWDDKMYEIYALKRDENPTFAKWKKFVEPQDLKRILDVVEKALNGDEPFEERFNIKDGNGEKKTIHLTMVSIGENKDKRLIGINKDITLESEMENQRILYEDARRKQIRDLLRNIAHHWRQPLNSLSVCLDYMGDVIKDSESKKAFDEISKDMHNDLNELSRNINIFSDEYENSSKSSENPTLKNSLEKCMHMMDAILHENSINTHIDFVEDFLMPIDRSQGIEIFSNLFMNVVEIKKKRELDDVEISIRARRVGENVIMTFEDNCGGIDEELMPDALFTPYTTTNFKSRDRGLGLYVVSYTIRNGLNGTIRAENTKNGAKLTIVFPSVD